ncbi:MAG: hypothetical protein ACO25F_03770 [Erythrobacter sp.]
MTGAAKYQVPEGPLRLAGAVARPAPGTLPLRGDLAHIALAGKHLAAHYVIPQDRTVASDGLAMHLAARADSDTVTTLARGTALEVLDVAGEWAWACLGPDGPSGYVPLAGLAPADA